MVHLANSTIPGLSGSGVSPIVTPPGQASQPVTLTVTLRRTNQSAFTQYLSAVQDPSSAAYHHFLSQSEVSEVFGPSASAYKAVLSWLRSKRFSLVQGSADRLTLTVKGSHALADNAFGVSTANYRVGGRDVYANTDAPSVPASIAAYVQSISGLDDVAQPRAPQNAYTNDLNNVSPCVGDVVSIFLPNAEPIALEAGLIALTILAPELVLLIAFFEGLVLGATAGASVANFVQYFNCLSTYANGIGGGTSGASGGGTSPHALATQTQLVPQVTDPAEKIGLLEFDTYRQSDVSDWINLSKANTAALSQLSEVPVNGGVASPGAGEAEVLLDIDTVLDLAHENSPPQTVVYDAPPSTSFEQMFNAMIGDGDTVISNSWTECEDEVSQSDAQSIDSVLAQAAASGISVFNGSGDDGSNCLDGSPNTIGVPEDSPNATSVGGTTPTFGTALNVVSQSWWNGSASTPPTGEGGFGVSKYFSRPAYQNGFTTSSDRSVPDLAVDADPNDGIEFCQADDGGCPDGRLNGGTSMAAPEMAIETAQLDQALGSNIGNFNAAMYPIADDPNTFTTPTDMGSDFSHVGLGAPNFNYIYLALKGLSIGAVSPSVSTVAALPAPADGSTPGVVRVQLLDANGSPVQGKSVGITTSSSTAVVSGSPAVTNAQGIAIVSVTDTVAEPVKVTTTDTTDGITLSTQPTIQFVPPPATAGSITANPPTVANDGTSAATITVTLQNAKGQGAEGKTITLSEGSADAQITPTGATPGVTNSSGVATFTATDTQAEAVTFTATDVTDGNLPVPGSATVTYSGDASSSCVAGTPAAENGAAVSVFSSGIPSGPFGTNACDGAFGLAFDGSGNTFVSDQFNGNLYKFPSGGGTADPSTLLSDALGGGAYDLTFGTDGELYGVIPGTSTTCNCGSVVQLNPQTGAIIRTLSNTLNFPTWIATDPISGDLFFTNGASAGSPNVYRIQDPSSSSPTVSVYGSDSSGFTQLAFAPNGTLYALNRNNQLVSFGGTNTSQPATETIVAGVPSGGFGLALGPISSNGTPSSVYMTESGDITQVSLPSGTTTQLESGGAGDLKVGPDGCLYATNTTEVLRVTSTSGSCDLTSSTGSPSLNLSGPGVTNPPAGSAVTLTAQLSNVSSPAGTPIIFTVTGANAQVKLVNASASGSASFTYSALHTGTDTVTATTTVGTVMPVSNQISFTWAAGKDTSFITLNGSQEIGPVGTPATIDANLSDISQSPATPVGSASISVLVGTQTCTITTNAAGSGSCQITPVAAGLLPVTATYAGSGTLTASTATDSFFAGGPSTTPPPGAPTITSAATDTVPSGTAFTYSVTTTGTPTPAITLASGSTLPTGVTLTDNGNGTATLAGTASVAAGVYTFTIQAANEVTPNATQGFTLTVASPSIGIVKTTNGSNGQFIPVGSPVTWSYAVTNTGTVTLSPVTVTDNEVASTSISCAGRTNVISTMAPGASVTCTATGTSVAGAYSNIGTATGTPPGGGTPVSSTSTGSYFGSNPSISVTKSASIASYSAPGTPVTYSYKVTNIGNVALTPVTVTDPMTGLSAITCPQTSLAAGAGETCTATYTTTQADVDVGALTNTGTATGTPPVGANVSATSSVDIPAVQSPKIGIVKSASISGFSAAGIPVTYSYQVTNTGNVTLNPVAVTDPMKGLSPVTCTSTSLAPTVSETCTASYTTTQADVAAGSIKNTGTATGTSPSGTTVTATSSVTVPAKQAPAIGIVKTASIKSYSAPGTLVTYYYKVTNTGNVTLTSVTVTDPMSGLSKVSCPGTSLAPAVSETCTATYTTTQADVDRGSIKNTGTVSGTSPSGTKVTASSTAIVPAIQTPKITLVKSASISSFSAPGTKVTYSYKVTDTGNVTLGLVTVVDPMFWLSRISCPGTTLSPGASETCTATYTTTQADVDRGSIKNIGAVFAVSRSWRLVAAYSTVIVPAIQTPKIAMVKSASISSFSVPGTKVTYSYKVTDTGNVTLTSVTVTDPMSGLSKISCPATKLSPGATETCTATYTTTQTDVKRGSISNTGTATGTSQSGTKVSASSTVIVPVKKT
jgi:uncharacterized repeat protein (TIGR01451 family)